MTKQQCEQLNQGLSVYIHWPFCRSKCPYCDFNSHVLNDVNHIIWQQSYLKEIQHFCNLIHNKKIKSIFFGGGTPSLMDALTVELIINKINSIGVLDENTEITIEANPTSVEASKFKEFKAAGVNRVSIGVQSFNESELKFLGRQHSSEEAKKAIDVAVNNFEKCSFDLIYALPNQTIKDLENTVETALRFGTKHISMYQLTIEKGTKFYSMYNKNEFKLPSHELSGQMYDFVDQRLESEGFNRYEISNYAKDGNECKHNLCYWNYDEYLGIGPGAHSRLTTSQNGNLKCHAMHMIYNPQNWLKQIDTMGHGIMETNTLSRQELLDEITMMGLRTKYGISNTKTQKYLYADAVELLNQNKLSEFKKIGLLEVFEDRIVLTKNGMNLHSYIIKNLL